MTFVSLFQFSLCFKSPRTPQKCGVFVWSNFQDDHALKSRATLSSGEAKNGTLEGFEKYFHFF